MCYLYSGHQRGTEEQSPVISMEPEELWVVDFKRVLGLAGSPEVTEVSVWDNDFKQILLGKHSEI